MEEGKIVMKKTFTDNLPKWQNGRYKGKINWKISINYEVNFIYDNIKGKVKIIDYYNKNNRYYLDIKYKNKVYPIERGQFIRCGLGGVLNIYDYKYKVGDIITNINSGKLKILEQIKIKDRKEQNHKGYRYQCLNCGNKDVITEGHLKEHKGCNVCCPNPQKVLIRYNDMWTTNPELAKLLADPNDGYKYTQSSNKRVNWKCPECDNIIKNKIISMINSNGLSCPKCSDKISYPEKFVFNILQQLLNNDFTYQLSKTTFKWCNNYKYDFYFKINNEKYVLETHGIQHYEESPRGRNLEEEQENDKLKKELAITNGIKEDNYIVIDCRYSILEWIKEHILKSKLNELFNLNNINWLECNKYACSSLVKKVCEIKKNNSNITTTNIGNIFKLDRNTIREYLKQGTKIGWCKYNSKNESNKNLQKNTLLNQKKIICLNNKKIFNSILNAEKYYKINGISANCKNKRNYAGVDADTGNYLQWQYYDEYLIKPKNLLSNKEINKLKYKFRHNTKPVICLNNKKVYKSIKDACNSTGTNTRNICSCCRERRICAGTDPITKEKLQWQYYEDYLINPKKLATNNKKHKHYSYEHSNKIICLNTNEVFYSISDASRKYNIDRAGIAKCCTGKRKSAGKDPSTNKSLRWIYYKDYLKLNNKEVNNGDDNK